VKLKSLHNSEQCSGLLWPPTTWPIGYNVTPELMKPFSFSRDKMKMRVMHMIIWAGNFGVVITCEWVPGGKQISVVL